MEAEAALELVKQGVTLLLLDVPQNTLIGIDTQVCISLWNSLFEFSELIDIVLSFKKFRYL